MTKTEFEAKHDVRLVPKNKVWWGLLIGYFWPRFVFGFWTTVRLPFGKSTIAHPPGIDPMLPEYDQTRSHELGHVEQQRTAWGLLKSFLLYFFFPLPVVFSGRWFVERELFLEDILAGELTVERAVNLLFWSYFFAWPRFLMRRWFEDQMWKRRDRW